MDFIAVIACLGVFGMVCGIVGYRLGNEDGRIEERRSLYWRTHRSDRERL